MKQLKVFLTNSHHTNFKIDPIRIKCNSLTGETEIIEIKKSGKVWLATDVWLNCFTVSKLDKAIKKQIYDWLINNNKL